MSWNGDNRNDAKDNRACRYERKELNGDSKKARDYRT
jgi:hypothetical protein